MPPSDDSAQSTAADGARPPPGNTPSLGKLADITMLVHYGALERTEAEYRVLLEAAGFTLERIIPTQTPLSIIEGVPA